MDLPVYGSMEEMRKELVDCRLCKRLVEFRESVPVRRAFEGEEYWRRPVPGFGDVEARLMILGLAPSAQGGNRTGRIFTGDESARFLFRALHGAGLANRGVSERRGDGLELKGCYLTAAVKCVPPENRPTGEETVCCRRYLWNEMRLLKRVEAVLVLGQFALGAYLGYVKGEGGRVAGVAFRHGACYEVEGFARVYMSYHPSPQNTNTGKLTEAMFDEVLQRIKRDLKL